MWRLLNWCFDQNMYFFQHDHIHTFKNTNFFFKDYQYTNAPNHESKIKAHAHMVRIVWLWHLQAPINIKFTSYTLQTNNLSHSCLENKSHYTHNEHCVPTSNVKCKIFVKCICIKLRAPWFAMWWTWNSFQVEICQ
jgi:hypothetical protein